MNPATFNRLHSLRMENDAAGYALDDARPRFDRLRARHENGAAPVAVSEFQLFQTPPAVAARLVALLGLRPGARVLEPSAGLGRLLDALQACQPREVVAVEMAAACAGQLYRQDRPGVVIRQRDFLAVDPAELGAFDAVVMNPPFHLRADIRHILHARRFLKPGGMLAAVCMAGASREAALRPLACHWEPLPAGTFRAEGTPVGAVLLAIRGRPPSDDIRRPRGRPTSKRHDPQ
jgi:SAM-dependent methyltransferase